MPVYKDKDRGTWYYSYKRRDPVSGQWKNIKKRGFRTKAEAKAAERDALSSGSKPSSATFAEMATLWEEYTGASDIVKTKHREHFTIRFSEHMDQPVESLTKPVLARFRAKLAQDDRFSTNTKNQTMRFIRGVLKHAHDIYGLPDYSRVLTALKETDEEALKEFDVWTPEEFERFIQAVENPLYALYYTFIYWTGCRRGEAIAIQKDQIGDHTATFKYSQITQKGGLKPTKTRAARTIKLDDQLFDQIKPLLEQPGNYLFGGIAGLSPYMVRDYFQKAIEKSGVKPIRLHDLRHSHASWLINNGVNIVAVSKRLGHKDVATTLRVYTHLLELSDNEMMAKINAYKSK